MWECVGDKAARKPARPTDWPAAARHRQHKPAGMPRRPDGAPIHNEVLEKFRAARHAAPAGIGAGTDRPVGSMTNGGPGRARIEAPRLGRPARRRRPVSGRPPVGLADQSNSTRQRMVPATCDSFSTASGEDVASMSMTT